ncbi:MAG: hypothetical protein QNJ98_08230 [Planctomycetota bacterium]|nr:hypothetical protein [Planctomycetota bacterium]
MQEYRIQELRNALRDHLSPGESFRAYWQDDELRVVPDEGDAGLVYEDKAFYGMLLTINERVSNAGTTLALFGLGLSAFVILSIAFNWFPDLTGGLDDLRAWWFYVMAGLAGLVFTGWLTGFRERAAFRETERDLEDGLDRLGLTRYALLAIINDDEELSSLVEMLKSSQPAR